LSRFERGRTQFHREFQPEDGLGPLFNQQRCSSCHDLPALGGFGVESVEKATHFDPATGCDLLLDQGGDMIQQRGTPLLAAAGIQRETLPERATQLVQVRPPPLYGLGLVEALPDSIILLRADSADDDGDGISGRIGRAAGGRLGRFGRRAEFATLEDFITNALLLEMGITSTAHPEEEKVNGAALPPGVDPVPDPEAPDTFVALVTDFVRFLAMPIPEASTSSELADTLRRGEQAFRQARCDACHVREVGVTRSGIPALHDKTVVLYSDLLLHDLGKDVATTCGPGAIPSEYRTAPLAGLRFRQPYMHDGRAHDLLSAVLLHGGEAGAALRSFDSLEPGAREALIRFLRSL
jgi:CxxC motif-containing protein (DUF1111 family)